MYIYIIKYILVLALYVCALSKLSDPLSICSSSQSLLPSFFLCYKYFLASYTKLNIIEPSKSFKYKFSVFCAKKMSVIISLYLCVYMCVYYNYIQYNKNIHIHMCKWLYFIILCSTKEHLTLDRQLDIFPWKRCH